MLNTINLYNEKGNVKVAVRNAIKEASTPVLFDALATTGRDVVIGTDGAFYVPLALDENGGTIYARLDATISVKDPNAPIVKKETKTADPVEIDLGL